MGLSRTRYAVRHYFGLVWCISSWYNNHRSYIDYYAGRVVEKGDPHLHLLVGEATVTLHDVTVVMGFPIDGRVVISPIIVTCEPFIKSNPVLTPDDRALTGTGLQLRWLHENYRLRQAYDATEDVMRQLFELMF